MTLYSATMHKRFAAQSVFADLLRVRGSSSRRSSLARLFGLSPLGADSMSWYLGAEGEIVVGSFLAKLPPDWTVFHAVPADSTRSETDHLVIGPGGIFTITSKNHAVDIRVGRNTLQVDSQPVSYLQNAEAEAERVTNLVRERMPLVAPVQPVLVFVDPGLLTIEAKPVQVKVLNALDLCPWLIRLHPVLTAGEVQEVADLLDSPQVWRALPDSTPEAVQERFTELDVRLRSAGRRWLTWAVIAAIAAIAAGFGVLQLITAATAAG
ncbi:MULTISPECIES: nuclease-related domain-containing protein [Cryobacterium]|uniref:NERD domain-containing protein n=1 Tax=Cryobacterium breve TaxID=1259258 RepID=A0ABY2IUZ5_9MICO|nr:MULTISPECIES: nuclease-related domain-containing protein [Cryobacterium]TFC93636.1 NERD domain-containing protein [Cryobacterium sp. TmT3-12]TFC95310.1 NERD domain-containing protein [Cryobacterium breve]